MVEESQNRVYKTVNTEMINLYWNIGKMIVEIQGGKEKAKYRGYIKSRHIDFILANSKFEIIAGIELDDWTHNREDAKEKDSFKDKVFQKIGIPLYRVKVNTEYTNEIEKIINNLHYPANTENS